MATSAILLEAASPCEEKITVPSGGYTANQLVQAPSGLAAWVDNPTASTAGTLQTLRTEGLLQLPCASALVAIAGTPAWFDSANDTVVDYAPAAGFWIGSFAAAKSAGQTTCRVILNQSGHAHSVPRVLTTTADYTATETDVAGNTILTNTGASGTITVSLPAALPGMRIRASVGVAQALRIDPNGTETISLPSSGVPGAAGKYLVADAIGETVDLVCVAAGSWSCFGYTGTWTAEP